MPTTPYKVLIIGCGNIAGGFDVRHPSDAPPFGHAKAYLQHGGFSLVACVEPDASKRAAFQEQWGITQGANTLADLQPAPREAPLQQQSRADGPGDARAQLLFG